MLLESIIVKADTYKLTNAEAVKYREELSELLYEGVKQGVTLYSVQQHTGINEATLRGMVKKVEQNRAHALSEIMADGVQPFKTILHLPGGYVFQDASVINEAGEVEYHFIISKRENPLLTNPTRFQYIFTTEHEWDWEIFDTLFGTRQAWEKPLEEIRYKRGILDLAEELAEEEIDNELDW